MIDTKDLKPLGYDWDLFRFDIEVGNSSFIKNVNSVAGNEATDIDAISETDETITSDTLAATQIKKFAKANNFQYVGDIGSDYAVFGYNKGLPPVSRVYDENNNEILTSRSYMQNLPSWTNGNALPNKQGLAVSIKLHGFSVLLFTDATVNAMYGDSSNQKPLYTYRSIICINLHTLFPQIVLDSNKNDALFLKTNSASIHPSQRLHLEANFSNYFDFYSPRGLHTNALTVLAPNFMQMLIDSAVTYDVEFFGDKMFFITGEPIYTDVVFTEAIDILEVQLKYLSRLEKSWSYEPIIQPFDYLKTTSIKNNYSVKFGKHRIGLLQIIATIFMVLVSIYLFYPILSQLFSQ